MTRSRVATIHPPRTYANRIVKVGTGAPPAWFLAAGRDFDRSFGPSILYGLIFVIAGIALTLAVFAADMAYLFFPLAAGFMLLGPAATLGFYQIGKDLEQGRRPSLWRALTACRANPGPMLYVGLALLSMFLLWLRLSQLAFALCFPNSGPLDSASLLHTMLLTGDGQVFTALTLGLGAIMAALTFAGAAFALPMLLDRQVGMVEAVATSWTAVMMNLPAMATWAVLLVTITAIGMALGFVGLAVTLPMAGHATWHAYRSVIRGDEG